MIGSASIIRNFQCIPLDYGDAQTIAPRQSVVMAVSFFTRIDNFAFRFYHLFLVIFCRSFTFTLSYQIKECTYSRHVLFFSLSCILFPFQTGLGHLVIINARSYNSCSYSICFYMHDLSLIHCS